MKVTLEFWPPDLLAIGGELVEEICAACEGKGQHIRNLFNNKVIVDTCSICQGDGKHPNLLGMELLDFFRRNKRFVTFDPK